MYRLIYAVMPNMMLKGINEFYGNKEMQDEQQYEWIKGIYNPKPPTTTINYKNIHTIFHSRTHPKLTNSK